MEELKSRMKEIWETFYDVIQMLCNLVIWGYSTMLCIIFYFTGGEDTAIRAVLFAMVVDYITGIVKAIYMKNLNSKIGFKGIFKKVMILLVISVASKVDLLLTIESLKINMRFITICFYCSNELISFLENISKMGVPVPQQLIDILEQCKNKKIK